MAQSEDARRSAMDRVAAVALQSLAAGAKEQHGSLAQMSHMAALIVERLEQGTVVQGTERIELAALEYEAIRMMLRQVQNEGHLAFLKRHGDEFDYQAIGLKVRKSYQTPSGKWRKGK